MGVCQYARYVNVITALRYASGYAFMNEVCIGYEWGMHQGTHQVITLFCQNR